jgi:hypothetical protein
MNTAEIWNEGDQSRGICESCRVVVDTRFEFRDYELHAPRVVVPALLVAVCTICDRIVAIPMQSAARLNAARRAGEER